jgi:hypothetical protein
VSLSSPTEQGKVAKWNAEKEKAPVKLVQNESCSGKQNKFSWTALVGKVHRNNPL